MLLVLVPVLSVLVLVLLTPLCVRCHRRPMRSISETHTSEDTYIPSTQFRIHRPGQTSTDQNYAHSLSNHLSPHVSVTRPSCPSVTPTETESNNSYENAVLPDSESEEAAVDHGYIEVLPETPPPLDNSSRASSPCSEHLYVNVESPSDDYLNVQMDPHDELEICANNDSFHHHDPSSDSDDSDDSGDEGNYVNQPSKAQ